MRRDLDVGGRALEVEATARADSGLYGQVVQHAVLRRDATQVGGVRLEALLQRRLVLGGLRVRPGAPPAFAFLSRASHHVIMLCVLCTVDRDALDGRRAARRASRDGQHGRVQGNAHAACAPPAARRLALGGHESAAACFVLLIWLIAATNALCKLLYLV